MRPRTRSFFLVTNNPDPIRIGVIGAGGITVAAHLPAIVCQPAARLAWISDRSADRARLVGRAYGVPGYDEGILQREPDCDVILLAAPYGVREPYYARFGSHGVGWYVEKPFARTEEEHRIRCETLGNRRVACGFQRRACGLVRVAREAVSERLFGKLRRVEMGFGRRGRILGGGTYATDPKQAGGGILAEVGIHNVDAIFHLTGARDFSILDARTVVDHGMDIHTEASISLALADGDPVEFSFVVSSLVDTREMIDLHFEHASLAFSIFGEPVIRVTGARGKSGFVLSDPRGLYPSTSDQIFHSFWEAFLTGFRTGAPSMALAEGSLLTTRLVEQIYARSAHPEGSPP